MLFDDGAIKGRIGFGFGGTLDATTKTVNRPACHNNAFAKSQYALVLVNKPSLGYSIMANCKAEAKMDGLVLMAPQKSPVF